MSEAQLAAATAARPELARELPADPDARAETRVRAAQSVAAFAQTSACQALDAVLGADGPAPARQAASQATAHSELLDAEVRRFRALADQKG
jgi:hypothetical protein